ncbi:MAG: TonB-dependent receptor plug domain-containing protein [Flavobacterium sp.]
MPFKVVRSSFFFFLISFVASSQAINDSTTTIALNELVVSNRRFAQPKKKMTQQIETLSKKQIEFQNFQTSADALANSGTLAVQKSQQGGGSPIIRGFESSRILLLVDGIRMNNLIYRAGHLQNILTVDKNMLENIEVLFGPSSTIYGSDAMGGAIFLQTKNARLLDENNHQKFSGAVLSSFNSVNDGTSGHFEFNFAGTRWASLTSFSYNEFEDLRMGKQQNGKNPFFGERLYYVVTKNGIDTQVANPNQYLQKFSGYTQYDVMQKVVYKPSDMVKHQLNIQYSTSSDIPRYDRLTDTNAAGKLRSAVWNYGPQDRFLAAYKLEKKDIFGCTTLHLNASYQKVEESRITRSFGSTNQTSRTEKVNVYALTSDFKTKIGKGDLVYGADFYYDDLRSKGIRKNILTGVESITDSRYPDGKNNTLRAESFVYYNNEINALTTFNTSFRGGFTQVNSETNSNFFKLPYTTVQQENFTYSGAIGIVHNPNNNVKMIFNVASAFRVPNIDDLAKIFESIPGSVIVPNQNIKPEQSITTDFGLTFRKGKHFQLENTFFYTRLFDAIVTAPFVLNGQNNMLYEGQLSQIYANQNQGKGEIIGISTTLKAYLIPKLLMYGSFNYTHGSVENNSGRFPLDHIAPTYGKAGISYEAPKLMLDAYILYNGKKRLSDYSPSGEDNAHYAPANGMPAWETYHVKGSYLLLSPLTIFTGIENLLDTQYRTFASGINAAGRNFYLGGKYRF